MMDVGSFTSEPQYQRPDDKNDMVHYIPRPEVVQQPVVQKPIMPAVAPIAWRYLDPNMARPLFNKFGNGAWIFNRLDFYGNSIILGSFRRIRSNHCRILRILQRSFIPLHTLFMLRILLPYSLCLCFYPCSFRNK